MEILENIDEQFEREKLIDTFARYELYYHIGLGRLVYITIQDVDETYKKLEELDLKIDSIKVINTIYQTILRFSDQGGFDKRFKYYIKSRALGQALEDFIQNDKELHNPEAFAEQMHKDIIDDKFFDEKMKDQFKADYDEIYVSYTNLVSEDKAKGIKDSVLKAMGY